MKKLLWLLIIPMIMSSCGMFRKVSRQKESNETTISEQSSSKESTQTIDKSIINESIKVDTLLHTPAKEINTTKEIDLQDLLNGVIVIDTNLVKISQHYDAQSKKLKTTINLKPQPLPFEFEKKTETKKDIVTNTIKKDSLNKDTHIESDKLDVKKEPTYKGLIVVIGFIVLFLFICWVARKLYIKFKG